LKKKISIYISITLMFTLSCATHSRMGMIKDNETGLQYGSIVERNLVIDSAQMENKYLKISIRNISGDSSYDSHSLSGYLEKRYLSKGYLITQGDNYGIYMDINLLYSGKIQKDMRSEYGFLGVATGGIIGYRSNATAGTAIGLFTGATLGSIIGSYVTDDTYIILVDVNIGIVRPQSGITDTTIVFSASKKEKYQERTGVTHFSEKLHTRIAVYAGGRNVIQNQIAGGVKERMKSILADII